jgi:putative oxidoreductase
MKTKFLSSTPLAPNTGLFLIRVVTGLLVAFHGLELFDAKKIAEYTTWDTIKQLPNAYAWVWAGKAAELLGGVLLALGWFTRLAALLTIGPMLFICFKLGNGKFWYEDQHPFLFVLLALVYFFLGAGPISIDHRLQQNRPK